MPSSRSKAKTLCKSNAKCFCLLMTRFMYNSIIIIDQNIQVSKPPFPTLAITLIIMSFLILATGVVMYALADIQNHWDFLLPVIASTQFIFASMILFGRIIGLIGLIGYGIFILALAIAIVGYYANIGQPVAAVTTLPVLVIPTIPLVLIWRNNRNYFLR